MLIPVLYHWSPVDRFDDIRTNGLRPHAPPANASVSLPYVCLSPRPSRAWSLSGGMEIGTEADDWDLYEVRIADGDHVVVRPDFGPEIQEIKVYGPIAPDRVWWVARRGSTPATVCLEVPRSAAKKAGKKATIKKATDRDGR